MIGNEIQNIGELSDEQLKYWLCVIPSLFKLSPTAQKRRNITVEDIVVRYILITDEMKRREIDFHPDPSLEKETTKITGKRTLKYDNIKKCFDKFNDFEIDNYILMVGRVVEDGDSSDHLDILIRHDFRDEKLEQSILRMLPEDMAKRVQFVYTRDVPEEKFVPLYRLRFEKITDLEIQDLSSEDNK